MSILREQKIISHLGLFLALLLIVVSFASSWFWHQRDHDHLSGGREPIDGKQLRDKGGYRFISPLLDCRASNDGSFERASQMKREIVKVEERIVTNPDIFHLSVYFLDLNEGYWVGQNENERFTPASLMKVPVLIAYLKKAQDDPDLLTKKLVYRDDVNAPKATYSYQPTKRLVAGREYSIEEILEHMIVYSDNNAVQLLLSQIDSSYYEDVYDDLMISSYYSGETENYMTVREYSAFFRVLYNASYLNRKMSEKALDILSRSDFSLGLTAGLPRNQVVAHKYGERETGDYKQLHDCGIIYRKDSPYLLCVMTRGNDYKKLEELIREVSSKVWQTLNSELKS